MIAVEVITVEAIAVETIAVEVIVVGTNAVRGSTQKCIMGIVRCIMGNAFCSTTDLQVPSVCTSFVKFGIYWEKNKEDRLVHNHEFSVPPRHSVRSTGWPLVFFDRYVIAILLFCYFIA